MTTDVVVAHDYFTQRGGAERVALDLSRTFGYAEIHTSFYQPEGTHARAGDHRIVPSKFNRIGSLRRDPRKALPLLPMIFTSMQPEGNVLLASSSGWAHGIGGSFDRRVVYCHNPARWLYQPEDYSMPSALRRWAGANAALSSRLRAWDQSAASRADVYLANSAVVAERVERTYGRPAEVLHPPVPDLAGMEQQGVPALTGQEFLLCVARLQPYKHVLEVIEGALEQRDLRLVVVGDGPLRSELARLADHPQLHWLASVSDGELAWLYANCIATISASHEDFGLTPVEGYQFGAPAILLRSGGFMETLREGETGVFFDHPTPGAIARAIGTFLEMHFEPAGIRRWAETFSYARFAQRLRELVATI